MVVPGDQGSAPSTRRNAVLRFAALAMALAFLAVTIASSARSLGAYCLTTHAGDVRRLPE
ncbi:MAG: hypothetical protein U0166_00180 [Acidobacteriota bacterium]